MLGFRVPLVPPMKIAWIDLRPYGYVGSSDNNGIIYCPYMPYTYKSDNLVEQQLELEELHKELQENYERVIS